MSALLGDRVRIDVAEYERIMKLRRDEPWTEPVAPGTFRLDRVENDRRIYVAGAA